MALFSSPRALDAAFRRYVKKGDGRALSRAFDLAAPEMLRTARHLCSDESEAEDAVQSAFLAAIERASAWDMDRALMPWLMGLLSVEVKRARERALRGANERWVADRIQGPGESPDPTADAAAGELRELVEEEIEALPDTYRTALKGHLLDGAAPKEIADGLGISVGALHVRLHRGIRLLRGALPAGAALSAGLVSPPSRGLDAIRKSVLGGAGVKAATTGGVVASWSGSPLVAGGMAAGAVTVLGAGAFAVWGGGPGSSVDDVRRGVEVASTPGSTDSGDGSIPISDSPVSPPGGGALSVGSQGASNGDPIIGTADADGSRRSPIATHLDHAAAPVTDEVWLERFREAQGYTRIAGVGHRIVELGPDQALPLITRLYDQLPSTNHRAQVLKSFHFNGGTDYVLDVLHLGATHAEAKPRQHAMSHLQNYAFEDFSGHPEGYVRWRASIDGTDRAEALRRGATAFAVKLQSAQPAQLAELLNGLKPVKAHVLAAVEVDVAAIFRDHGLTDRALEDLGGGSSSAAAPWLPWVPVLDLPESDLRQRVLPWTESPQADVAAAAFAALSAAPWLPSEFCSRLEADTNRWGRCAPFLDALSKAGALAPRGTRLSLARRIATCLGESASPAARESISTRVLCPLTGRSTPDDHGAADWLAWLDIESQTPSQR